MPDVQGATGALTEGTGVSPLTIPKLAKDFVVDFVKTLAAVFVANNLISVQSAIDNPHLVITAGLGALISTGYRFILRWGS